MNPTARPWPGLGDARLRRRIGSRVLALRRSCPLSGGEGPLLDGRRDPARGSKTRPAPSLSVRDGPTSIESALAMGRLRMRSQRRRTGAPRKSPDLEVLRDSGPGRARHFALVAGSSTGLARSERPITGVNNGVPGRIGRPPGGTRSLPEGTRDPSRGRDCELWRGERVGSGLASLPPHRPSEDGWRREWRRGSSLYAVATETTARRAGSTR